MKKNILKVSLLGLSLSFILGLGVSFGNNQIIKSANALESGFAGGSGLEHDPYLIANDEQYYYFASLINNEAHEYDYLGKYFKLINDIGMTTPVTCMVGSINKPFKGIFEGNGHTVNVNIYSEEENVGLFGYATFVSPYAAETNPGYIREVTVKGQIRCSENAVNVGGIVGFANSILLYNCTNYATIEVDSNKVNNSSIGGICGKISRYTRVTNCSNFGFITVNGETGKEVAVGGVVGRNSADVLNCANYGEVRPNPLPNVFLGGITGIMENEYFAEGLVPVFNPVMQTAINTYGLGGGLYTMGEIVGKIVGPAEKDEICPHILNAYFVSDTFGVDTAIGAHYGYYEADCYVISDADAQAGRNNPGSLISKISEYNHDSAFRNDYSTWTMDKSVSNYPVIMRMYMGIKIAFSYTNKEDINNDFRIVIGIAKNATDDYRQYSGCSNGGFIVYKNEANWLKIDALKGKAYQYVDNDWQSTELLFDNDGEFYYVTIELGNLFDDAYKGNAETIFSVGRFTKRGGQDELPEITNKSFKSLLNEYLAMPEYKDNTSLKRCKTDLGF